MLRFYTYCILLFGCFNVIQAQNKAVPFESEYFKVPSVDPKLKKLELLAVAGDSRWVNPASFTAGDVRYAANDSIIIIAGNDYLTAWDSKSGKRLWEYRFDHKRGYSNMTRTLSISKDKAWVAAANDGNGLYIFNYYTGKLIKLLPFDDMFVFGSISPNGKWAAVYGLNNGWKLWNLSKDELHSESAEKITAISFSPDGKTCAISRPTDNEIYKIQILKMADNTRKSVDVDISPSNNCQTLHFSPDGNLLAMGFWGGDFAVYDLKSNKLLTRKNIDKSWVDGLAFSPDGNKLLVLGAVTIKIWNKEDDSLTDWGPSDIIYPNNCLEDGVWSKDGRQIMLAAREWQRPRRFSSDAAAEEIYKSEGFVSTNVELAFTVKENKIAIKTPDGKTVYADFNQKKGLKDWNFEFNKEEAKTLGNWQSKSVNIQSIDNIGLLNVLPGEVEKWHNGPSSLLCEHYFGGFTEDKSLYAGVGNDRVIYVYDGKTGNPLAGVAVKGTYIQAAAISPDGNYLVAMGWDALLRLYKIPKLN